MWSIPYIKTVVRPIPYVTHFPESLIGETGPDDE
jgi:hypothetical protein